MLTSYAEGLERSKTPGYVLRYDEREPDEFDLLTDRPIRLKRQAVSFATPGRFSAYPDASTYHVLDATTLASNLLAVPERVQS